MGSRFSTKSGSRSVKSSGKLGSQVAGLKSRKPGTKRTGIKFPNRDCASSNSDCDSISQTSRSTLYDFASDKMSSHERWFMCDICSFSHLSPQIISQHYRTKHSVYKLVEKVIESCEVK